ncbi:hypothetical protein [Microvirga sp. Mcv34]|uniref:hypothetical protein n=1 Tax=Microvirga sp. Mcv34 TaxID=2926016 RepID=UPI0021C6CBC0|nr:hypothetical protein [Microvirga sp. Mcv34]
MARRICAFLPLVTCISSVALAEPTIYRGTLGKHDIVVELSDDITSAGEPVAGRYFYPAQGVDIPLDPVSTNSGKAVLDEEKACNRKICTYPGGEEKTKAPVEARWHLTAAPNGALEGSWQRKGASPLPIRLDRIATRAKGELFSATPEGLADILITLLHTDDKPLDPAVSPYDILKMQVRLQEGPETMWGDVAFRFVVDPRTKVAFPRITRLESPIDTDHPANLYLQSQHWRWNLDALSCKAKQYAGLGWTNIYPAESGPDLGGIDELTIQVEYLSPAIMSWSETGSIFCGGAHPSHIANAVTLDVKRGERFDVSRIFRSWVPSSIGDNKRVDLAQARANPNAYSWGPDNEFRAFLLKRAKEKGNDLPGECELGDVIKDHLEVSFKQGDQAVFALNGLPHAISGVCQGAFLEAPLRDFRDFLTPEAVDYFPSLRAP